MFYTAKKYVFFILITFLFFCNHSFSQLILTPNLNANQLVDVLAGGGITYSNAVYSGAGISRGSFTTGATPTNLGIHSGIILSTGTILDAPGPNNGPSTGQSNGTGSDPQLATLIPGYTIYDACYLQFDFIPEADTIKFKYVFASEEYPEYVNSSFNDVFGFFISGPNPAGGNYNHYNIARVPGTNLPVTIDNVNHLVNSQYYVDNNFFGQGTIEYDGFTTVLTAWAHVVPCVQYTIKIAIGDAGDPYLDSAVFLEEGSFLSNSINITTSYSHPTIDTAAIKGCSFATVTFTMAQVATTNTTINFTVGGSAVSGVDYQPIPNSVTIPAGQNSVSFDIIPILSGIPGPTVDVLITAPTSFCFGSDSVIVYILNNDILTTLAKSNDTLLCGTGVDLFIEATGGIPPYTYLWSHGAGTGSQVTVNPSVNTTYTITITDDCGQSHTDQIAVNVASAGFVSPDTSICLGGAVLLTAGGGTSYLWSTGATTSSINVQPTQTTMYYVTVQGSCNGIDSVLVTVNPSPLLGVTAVPSILCLGDQTTLTANGAANYVWSTGQTVGTFNDTPLSAITYSVTGTNVYGCSDTASVFVEVFPTMYMSPDTAVCSGESVVLTAGGGTSYLWSTGATTSSINVQPTQTTIYYVTVQGSCNGIDSVLVTVNPSPLLGVTAAPSILCLGDQTTLTANGAANYVWSTGQTVGTFTDTPLSTITYSVTGTNVYGCPDTASVFVEVFPTMYMSPDTTICQGDAAVLSAYGGLSYSWSTGATTSSISVQPTQTTVFYVTIDGSCNGIDSVTVYVNPAPVIIASALPDSICFGVQTNISASGASSYFWSGGLTVASFTEIPQLTTTYSVTGTDANGCVGSGQVQVVVFPEVTVSVTPSSASICEGENVQLLATVTGQNPGILWSTGAQTSSVVATPTATTTYTVSATDANGCSSSSSAIVTVNPLPIVDFTANPLSGCMPLQVNFQNQSVGGHTYNWSFGNGTQSTDFQPNHLYSTAGTFSVSLLVTSSSGCIGSLTKTNYISAFPNPTAMFTHSANEETFESTVHFTDLSSGAVSWLWEFGDDNNGLSFYQNPSYTYYKPGNYTVWLKVANEYGCHDSTSALVPVRPLFTLYVPSAFTPNGDMSNDIFYAHGEGILEFEMYIYSRWGEMVFYTDDINRGWDGKHNNLDAPVDVYVYKINYADGYKKMNKVVGKVTLIR